MKKFLILLLLFLSTVSLAYGGACGCHVDIDLNWAKLKILADLKFSAKTRVPSSGIFDTQGYAIKFGGDLNLNENVIMKFVSNGILDGWGNKLNLSDGAGIWLDKDVTLTVRNMTIVNVQDTNNEWISSIRMTNTGSRLILENCELQLSRNYSFTLGHLYINRDVVFTGTCQFNFTATHGLFIDKNSTLCFDNETTFSYGPATSDRRDLIVLSDRTSKLYLNGCTLKSSTTGMQLTKGTLIIDGKCEFYNEDLGNGAARSLSQAITLGNGNVDDDLKIIIGPACGIDIKSGILAYQNAS